MTWILRMFERLIVTGLLALMMIAVLVSSVELALVLYNELMKPPFLLLNMEEMLQVFGFFLMVLIGLELLESIKAYLEEDRVHAEVVFLVAIVAVSRKVIIVDYKDITADMLFGMSAVIIALGVGYFLVRRALHDYGRARAGGRIDRAGEKNEKAPGTVTKSEMVTPQGLEP